MKHTTTTIFAFFDILYTADSLQHPYLGIIPVVYSPTVIQVPGFVGEVVDDVIGPFDGLLVLEMQPLRRFHDIWSRSILKLRFLIPVFEEVCLSRPL